MKAEQLLRAHGPGGLTLDALGGVLGLSRATIYRRVKSREALLALLAERGLDAGPTDTTRAKILDAAKVVFPQAGFEAATIEAIAAEAGVGPATVYRHFADKKGLIAAFIESISPRAKTWQIANASSGDLRADLYAQATWLLTAASVNPALAKFLFIERIRGNEAMLHASEGQMRTLHAVASMLRAHSQTHSQSGAMSEAESISYARGFLGILMFFGPVSQWMGAPVEGSIEGRARFVVDLFLDGFYGCETQKESACSTIKTPHGP